MERALKCKLQTLPLVLLRPLAACRTMFNIFFLKHTNYTGVYNSFLLIKSHFIVKQSMISFPCRSVVIYCCIYAHICLILNIISLAVPSCLALFLIVITLPC